jgi:hypothetical protein
MQSLLEMSIENSNTVSIDYEMVKDQRESNISENIYGPDLSIGIIFGNSFEGSKLDMYSARTINEQINSLLRYNLQDTFVAKHSLDEIESIGGTRIVLYYIDSSSRSCCVSQNQLYSNISVELEIKVLKTIYSTYVFTSHNGEITILKDNKVV